MSAVFVSGLTVATDADFLGIGWDGQIYRDNMRFMGFKKIYLEEFFLPILLFDIFMNVLRTFKSTIFFLNFISQIFAWMATQTKGEKKL